MTTMRVFLLLSLLLLTACSRQAWVDAGILADPPNYYAGSGRSFSCGDYADPALRLSCQQAVLGVYNTQQQSMYNRWGEATRVEPYYLPVPQQAPRLQTQCMTIGQMVTCQ